MIKRETEALLISDAFRWSISIPFNKYITICIIHKAICGRGMITPYWELVTHLSMQSSLLPKSTSKHLVFERSSCSNFSNTFSLSSVAWRILSMWL